MIYKCLLGFVVIAGTDLFDSTCSAGIWSCTEDECPGTCYAVGDPHYSTFDGMHYSYMGVCNYYMLHGGEYSVMTENEKCGKNGPVPASCTKTITVTYRDTVVLLEQNLKVEVNNKVVRHFPYSNKDIMVYMASSTVLKVG